MTNRAGRVGRVSGRLRRILTAVVGALLVLGALGMVDPEGPTAEPRAASGGQSVTVPGPPVWEPSTGTYGAPGAVTVTPSTNLGDQVVHVSWTGFTPSTWKSPGSPTYVSPGSGNVRYAVRVYECRGTNPVVTDCYGSSLYGMDPSKGFQQPRPAAGVTTPEFPSNMAIAVTHPDGTGSADIEVWTSHESQTLGCDPSHACSIVVEPNYGGNPTNLPGGGGCANHALDASRTATDTIIMYGSDFKNADADGESCAWNNHIVVPISFSPTAADCSAAAPQFHAAGLAMFDRAMEQWRAGFCQGSNALNLQYDFGTSEDEARSAFLGGTGTDVAMVGVPADPNASHVHAYSYAPLANSGISVVFRVDDPTTGVQLPAMNLDARLLAKMLTQSYVQGIGTSFPTVSGNPQCIFDDPEFMQLNPDNPALGASWPTCAAVAGIDLAGLSPVVIGGNSDLVYRLTSWIAGDPDARAFLTGRPDPWGMHVDTAYEQPAYPGYPVTSFVPQDFSEIPPPDKDHPAQPWKGLEWNPVQGGLDQVLRDLMENQPTCVLTDFNSSGGHDKCPPQGIGRRALFGIVDTGEAQAMSLPEAAVENPAGAFVKPTVDSMRAAVADMPAASTTDFQLLPYGQSGTAFSNDPSAYPLTMVQYAMVPTSGEPRATATAISGFVDRATASGQGQQYGRQPGQLALGYADLTQAQQEQATAVARHVAAQDGAQATGSPSGGASGGGSSGSGGSFGGASSGGIGSAGGAGAGGASGGGDTAGTSTGGSSAGAGHGLPVSKRGKPLATQPVAAGRPTLDSVGFVRLLVLLALIVGGVLAVGGTAVLVLAGTPLGDEIVARTRAAVTALDRAWNRALDRNPTLSRTVAALRRDTYASDGNEDHGHRRPTR